MEFIGPPGFANLTESDLELTPPHPTRLAFLTRHHVFAVTVCHLQQCDMDFSAGSVFGKCPCLLAFQTRIPFYLGRIKSILGVFIPASIRKVCGALSTGCRSRS